MMQTQHRYTKRRETYLQLEVEHTLSHHDSNIAQITHLSATARHYSPGSTATLQTTNYTAYVFDMTAYTYISQNHIDATATLNNTTAHRVYTWVTLPTKPPHPLHHQTPAAPDHQQQVPLQQHCVLVTGHQQASTTEHASASQACHHLRCTTLRRVMKGPPAYQAAGRPLMAAATHQTYS